MIAAGIATLAALLAYLPSSGSLIKRAAARAGISGKSKEVTFGGTLSVRGEPPRIAQLVVRFPLSCRLEVERGPASQAPAENLGARLVQLVCPLIASRGLPPAEAEQALRAAATSLGADLNAAPALSRLVDRVVYVLGAGGGPQLWLYKDWHAPARLIAQGTDVRLLEYGNPAAAMFFPRVLELWIDGQLAVKFEVLEARGMRGGEEEEYSRPE